MSILGKMADRSVYTIALETIRLRVMLIVGSQFGGNFPVMVVIAVASWLYIITFRHWFAAEDEKSWKERVWIRNAGREFTLKLKECKTE